MIMQRAEQFCGSTEKVTIVFLSGYCVNHRTIPQVSARVCTTCQCLLEKREKKQRRTSQAYKSKATVEGLPAQPIPRQGNAGGDHQAVLVRPYLRTRQKKGIRSQDLKKLPLGYLASKRMAGYSSLKSLHPSQGNSVFLLTKVFLKLCKTELFKHAFIYLQSFFLLSLVASSVSILLLLDRCFDYCF